MVALKGRNKSRRVELSKFRPFRAAVSDQYRDPGRRHARKTRIALPWADMFGPFRGEDLCITTRDDAPGYGEVGLRPNENAQSMTQTSYSHREFYAKLLQIGNAPISCSSFPSSSATCHSHSPPTNMQSAVQNIRPRTQCSRRDSFHVIASR